MLLQFFALKLHEIIKCLIIYSNYTHYFKIEHTYTTSLSMFTLESQGSTLSYNIIQKCTIQNPFFGVQERL